MKRSDLTPELIRTVIADFTPIAGRLKEIDRCCLRNEIPHGYGLNGDAMRIMDALKWLEHSLELEIQWAGEKT